MKRFSEEIIADPFKSICKGFITINLTNEELKKLKENIEIYIKGKYGDVLEAQISTELDLIKFVLRSKISGVDKEGYERASGLANVPRNVFEQILDYHCQSVEVLADQLQMSAKKHQLLRLNSWYKDLSF